MILVDVLFIEGYVVVQVFVSQMCFRISRTEPGACRKGRDTHRQVGLQETEGSRSAMNSILSL